MVTDVTFGSDAEFFLIKTDGTLLPAGEVIKGTKSAPLPVATLGAGYATQVDGLCAEVNIPPVRTPHDFAKALMTIRSHVNDIVVKHGAITCSLGASRVPIDLLDRPEVMEMGCDPSFNAYTGEQEKPGIPITPFRGAGFHIHIGYAEPTETVNRRLVQMLDYTLGTYATLHDPYVEDRRRIGYGFAGSYRPQKHGVEYRVLSTHMARDYASMAEVMTRVQRAIALCNMQTFQPPLRAVRLAIDECNEALLRRYSSMSMRTR